MPEFNKRIISAALSRKKVAPKMKAIPFPKAIERAYMNNLKEILNDLFQQVQTQLIRILPNVAQELGQVIKKDAAIDDIPKAINTIKENMFRKYTDKELKDFAKRKGMSVADYNTLATKQEFKRVAGVDLLMNNTALAQNVELFTINNVQLIKNLMTDATTKIENSILNGFSTGTRWEEIAKDVQKIIDPEEGTVSNRARLIARDQISKLNGQVTQERQKSLGITKYIWRTSQDERVRDSHAALEGEEFSWSNPPSVGHPGEDFQCRCTAEPVLSDFLD